jgi:hypothetical protein
LSTLNFGDAPDARIAGLSGGIVRAVRHPWKLTGVAVGAASLVAGTTTAYACVHTGSAPATSTVVATSPQIQSVNDIRDVSATAWQRLWAEHRLGTVAAIVDQLAGEISALTSDSTLTPRQADRLRGKVALLTDLRAKLAVLRATSGDVLTDADLQRLAALRTRLATLADRLRSALADATIAAPERPRVKAVPLAAATALGEVKADWRHHCDGHRWDGPWDGDRVGGDGDWDQDGYGGSYDGGGADWGDHHRDGDWRR